METAEQITTNEKGCEVIGFLIARLDTVDHLTDLKLARALLNTKNLHQGNRSSSLVSNDDTKKYPVAFICLINRKRFVSSARTVCMHKCELFQF